MSKNGIMNLNGGMKNLRSLREVFSSLKSCELDELDNEMSVNPELNTLLTTPGKDLPIKYRYLMGSVLSDWENKTLYDFIVLTLFAKGNKYHSYFSKAGNKFVGFAAYEVDSTCRFRPYVFVSEIKMFSFDLDRPNPVLIQDLKRLIDELLSQYKEVSWVAVKANPANRIYRAALNYYKDKYDVQVNSLEENILEYCIIKKEG